VYVLTLVVQCVGLYVINIYGQMDRVTIFSLLQVYPPPKNAQYLIHTHALEYFSTSRRLRVRFPFGSLGSFIYLGLQSSLRPWVNSVPNRKQNQEYLVGYRRPVPRTDNLNTFICQFS